MIELLALLLAALFVSGPLVPNGMTPACVLVNQRAEQPFPCKPEDLR